MCSPPGRQKLTSEQAHVEFGWGRKFLSVEGPASGLPLGSTRDSSSSSSTPVDGPQAQPMPSSEGDRERLQSPQTWPQEYPYHRGLCGAQELGTRWTDINNATSCIAMSSSLLLWCGCCQLYVIDGNTCCSMIRLQCQSHARQALLDAWQYSAINTLLLRQ